MTTIFTTVLEMSLKAGIVIVVVMLARLFLAKAPKKYSYFLWSVVAFRLCVPISFQSIFSIFGIGKTSSQTASSVTGNYGDTGTIFMPEMPSDPPAQSYVPNEGALSLDAVPNDVPALAINREQVLEIAIISIWLIGIAAMMVYGIVSYIKIHRKMRDAILVEENIYCSDKIDSPFTLGIIRPKIYLPFGLSDSEQMCIIEHERCHIRRHDHIIKLLAYIPLAIHWFNPLCWLAFNRMTLDMEMSCDEKVLTKHDDVRVKQQYTNVLLSFASGNRFPTPNPIAFSDTGSTKARIKHTLYWKKSKVWVNMVACLVCLTTLITCAADATADTKENGAAVNADNVSADNLPIETGPKNLLDILNNKQTFIAEDGTETLLRNYQIPSRLDDRTIHAQAYTFIDFDLDGAYELVVKCTEEANIYIIIRLYNGDAYGYSIGTRSFIDPKTDGTIISSDGAGINYIDSITFNKTKIEIKTIATKNDFENIYQIRGENVSEAEIDHFFKKHADKKDPSFWKALEITIDYVDDASINDIKDATYFWDKNVSGNDHHLVIRTNYTITDFQFLPIENGGMYTHNALYECKQLTKQNPLVICTHIDTTTNRGISFVDPNGVTRCYYISRNNKNGSPSLTEFSTLNQPPTPDIPERLNIYSDTLSPSREYTITEQMSFQIKLMEENGFLASKLGTGVIDVIIAKNDLRDSITFRKEDKYYSCLLNEALYGSNQSIQVFSTHAYVVAYSLIKNFEQDNFVFVVTIRNEQVVNMRCYRYDETTILQKSTVPDVISIVPNSAIHSDKKVSFTVSELGGSFYDGSLLS